MATQHDSLQRVVTWLTECLHSDHILVTALRNLRNGPEREVWDCALETDGIQAGAILTVFKPGTLESVNTSLPPGRAAQKCALAMTELPTLGIPAPLVLGHAAIGGEAAVLCERVKRTCWESDVRIEAARILARIHTLPESGLSEALQELARISDPREWRTTGVLAPQPEAKTLVHGDYFSANILPVEGGLRIIDWETFGWGDPMWDLGFLIGADRGLAYGEVEAVIAEYESGATVVRHRLMWHKRPWFEYWKQWERQLPSEAGGGGTSHRG